MSVTPSANTEALRRPQVARGELKESLIAADLTIEGKIEGSGHVRIAGSFKGDVNVQGNLDPSRSGARGYGGKSAPARSSWAGNCTAISKPPCASNCRKRAWWLAM